MNELLAVYPHIGYERFGFLRAKDEMPVLIPDSPLLPQSIIKYRVSRHLRQFDPLIEIVRWDMPMIWSTLRPLLPVNMRPVLVEVSDAVSGLVELSQSHVALHRDSNCFHRLLMDACESLVSHEMVEAVA